MRRLIAIVAVFLMTTPAVAEWPTTRYIPIPLEETFFANTDTEVTVENIVRGHLMRGAFGVLTDVLQIATLDSVKLEAAGFAAPVLHPLITDRTTGDRYLPLHWKEGFTAPMRHGCTVRGSLLGGEPEIRYTLDVNVEPFRYANISAGYNAGGVRRQYVLDWMSVTVTHEVVHGIQNTSFTNLRCDDSGAPKWFTEGTADGIAHYLLFERRPDAEEEYGAARNVRRWDESLDSRDVSIGNDYTYETGSFFRYLMEASKAGSGNGLAVMKDMFDMPRSDLATREGLLGGIEAAIKKQSGGRGLYQVLPEFFTEYGSYGVGRYKLDLSTPGSAATMHHERWLDKGFGGCVEFNVIPGNTVTKSVRVDDLAAECLHVKWSGFKVATALQIFAADPDGNYGDLHLGEAVRKDETGTKYCYVATKNLSKRIARKMTEKCMMRREAPKVGSKGAGSKDVAIWTSDFNVEIDGEAYFILSNVALKPAETKEQTVRVMIGAVAVESPQPQQKVVPRKPGNGNPTQNGNTDIDKRVHAMNGNEKRMMFDARTIFGQSVGLGFMDGIRDQGTIGKGLLTVVRGSNYWVGFVADARKFDSKSSAFVIKNPASFERGGYTNMMGAIVGGGRLGGNGNRQCGYDMAADISVLERSEAQMKFRIQVDMFDMARAMSGAFSGGSQCDMMSRAHVERADFTVTLPYGKLYDGSSTVERGHPPGQNLYDNVEFLKGPNLGGIETSLQLAGLSSEDDAPDAPSAPATGSGVLLDDAGTNGGNKVERCACGCPRIARPPTDICMEQCIRVWNKCAEK